MSEQATFTAWVTKHALTTGIKKIEAYSKTSASMITDANDKWASRPTPRSVR